MKTPSAEETVARMALERIKADAKAMAERRGLPPGLRYSTPDEELDLFDEWDPQVDPAAVLQERIAFHKGNGLDDESALAEGIVDTSAVGFKNRLKMAQADGRLTLTEQSNYLTKMAQKSRARKEQQLAEAQPAEAQPAAPAEGGV